MSEDSGKMEATKVLYIKAIITIVVIVFGTIFCYKYWNTEGTYLVSMKADKAAGYSWTLEIADDSVMALDKSYYEDGKFCFKLEGLKAGTVKVTLHKIKDSDETHVYDTRVYTFKVDEEKRIAFRSMTKGNQ